MKQVIFYLVFLTILTGPIYAQDAEKTEIIGRDLEWSDFVGTVDSSSKFDAFTAWTITYSFPAPRFSGDKVSIDVTVKLFLKSNSWVKPNKKTARLLNHEQGHFRIGRICANQISNTLNSSAFSKSDYHSEIQSMYMDIIEKCREVEKLYDKETDNYNNQAEQKRWDKKIAEYLKR